MKGKHLPVLVTILGAIALAGCGTTGIRSSGTDALAGLNECVSKGMGGQERGFNPDLVDAVIGQVETTSSGSEGEQSRTTVTLDDFLDCAVGPVDERNLEARLLRGHVIVAMLAQYGAFNVRFREYDQKRDDATALLAHIEEAERQLRSASAVRPWGGEPPQKTVTPTVDKVRRTVAVLQVAIDAERPTIRRARGEVLDLVAASSGSPGAIRTAVLDALTGLSKLARITLYGKAYLIDSRRFFEELNARGDPATVVPTAADWEGWDRVLVNACGQLGETAGVMPHCTS